MPVVDILINSQAVVQIAFCQMIEMPRLQKKKRESDFISQSTSIEDGSHHGLVSFLLNPQFDQYQSEEIPFMCCNRSSKRGILSDHSHSNQIRFRNILCIQSSPGTSGCSHGLVSGRRRPHAHRGVHGFVGGQLCELGVNERPMFRFPRL